MAAIETFLTHIKEGKDLSIQQASELFEAMMSGHIKEETLQALLLALKEKGESIDEIVGAVSVLRQKCTPLEISSSLQEQVIDTCGTGGDQKGSYNISTAVAFVVAACGVPVAKHGNKAISSRSGSADVLQALGVTIDADSAVMQRALEEAGICFMMAPHYHAAMKHVASARQALGVRTIFNLLGPLLNPAGAKRQVIGVYSRIWLEPLAEVLQHLGSVHAWVVCGKDGMDEITITDKTYVAELKDGAIRTFILDPKKYGFEYVSESALQGGDVSENAKALKSVLQGEQGAYRDIVLLNSAAGLVVAGKVSDMEEGLALARDAIDSGKALEILQQLITITGA